MNPPQNGTLGNSTIPPKNLQAGEGNSTPNLPQNGQGQPQQGNGMGPTFDSKGNPVFSLPPSVPYFFLINSIT
jgi:hypothetical protein